MYRIYKITANPVVDFAAEELKKYLRMMMPRAGEIDIRYDPSAKDGFRLGLMEDFSLDTSEAEDPVLDDILHIDTDGENGIIAGSNPRSVLLAVYRYLRENGCRWLFPGIDGEYIPVRDVKATFYHKMADSRYRGQCIEGGASQHAMLESIHFLPKVGMNISMMEFDNPKPYYKHYYHHINNPTREPELINDEITLQFKRQCEAEIAKRGLQFHDMGHGWGSESFGIDAWTKGKYEDVPEEARPYLAMVNGRREFFGGHAVNTNFCMSNPVARKKVVDHVCDYAQRQRNVDYLHVWLADGCNNHCECEECVKRTPSDWYVILLNEMDAELTARKLDTRIVFICYVDSTWPPETETLNNPDRFTMLLGAISRSYTQSVQVTDNPPALTPYVRNRVTLPSSVDEYVAYAKEWQKRCHTKCFVYEYHFWINHYYDPSAVGLAKIIYGDVHGYRNNGLDGVIEDGSQRVYFPNGFCFYTYANSLFDASLSFEEIREDYFSHAYGEDWRQVSDFMERVGSIFDHKYLAGERSANPAVGKHYNPAMGEQMRGIYDAVKAFEPFVEAHKNMPMRVQTVSMRILSRYLQYLTGIAPALIRKAFGAGEEAKAAYNEFLRSFGKYEVEMDLWYDQFMSAFAFLHRIFKVGESAVFGV